ncbi:MAG TPA: nuclear transport factor 2 family protein [Candidatus Saccharimonadales bacterium]|nr:nuclear transport factor 2 family protein [Candidatus Saccharimonadales bacterium]
MGSSTRNPGSVLPETQRDVQAADLAAIERLHNADIQATPSQDPAELNQLWSEDCVKLDGPAGPVVALDAIKAMYAKMKTDYPEFRILKYTNDVTDAKVVAGWAIEVGYSEAVYQLTNKEKPVAIPGTQGVRVLKKQNDGSWKFAVVGMK